MPDAGDTVKAGLEMPGRDLLATVTSKLLWGGALQLFNILIMVGQTYLERMITGFGRIHCLPQAVLGPVERILSPASTSFLHFARHRRWGRARALCQVPRLTIERRGPGVE